MDVLSSLIHYTKLHRARKEQKRTALHMLAASGVVRPSHVELRYPTHRQHYPLSRVASCDRAFADLTHPFAVMGAPHRVQHE